MAWVTNGFEDVHVLRRRRKPGRTWPPRGIPPVGSNRRTSRASQVRSLDAGSWEESFHPVVTLL
jgi:hypothetical protein